MKKYAIYLKLVMTLATIALTSCDRAKVISCNDNDVIIKLGQKLQSSDKLVNESINHITIDEKQATLTCHASINYYHRILAENITVNAEYKLDQSGAIISASLTKESLTRYNTWYHSLPQVINYQKTLSGNLAVIQSRTIPANNQNQSQELIFNNQQIQLGDNKHYSSITIDKKFSFPHNEVFIISAYLNQMQDQNINHNFLIGVTSDGKILTSQSFSYQESTLQQTQDTLTFKGINWKPYAESNDYAEYEYKNLRLAQTKQELPESYYRHKFSRINAEQILKQVKLDGCLNGDQFYLSDICSSKKITYCFEFGSIIPTPKNKTYIMLKEMCDPHPFSE